MEKERVDHPEHYLKHPAGIECVDVCEGFDFVIGNAIKYLWRAGLKGDRLEDLEKCLWYVERAIESENKKRERLKQKG